ncbi:MAG TPA: DUF87 domain-containing protein [Candidatus Saccharimonadales bacterium]|nr:DUF87 domain-containing protein [Candidatus Saccharimonadales bacterium]
MIAIIIVLVILFAIAATVAPIIYVQTRRHARDQKNYERGLKMVTLLIHLPPQSEDIEGNGRDVRDVLDENISKAQIIYNLIASTLQKGFKSRFYGQRHFSFEIVGTKGFVYFYATVPLGLVELVKQAIVSAYPTARLDEVVEPNIFNSAGRMSGVAGGEFTLKEAFAYPLATYQDVKRDAMQSVLNSLSTLEKEDGAAIQILMRPANGDWRKQAHEVAGKKRKGEKDQKSSQIALSVLQQFATAFIKPPEGKKDDKGKHELSTLDQAILDSIDEKTRHPGYEVLIRVVASSNVSQRSQTILSSIVAAFALFDAPGKNGLSFTPAKDLSSLVTSYILRFFPQNQNKDILNSVELATLFHFPDQKNIPTSQLERQGSKQVDGPRNMPDKGLLLGYNIFRGAKKPIRLSVQDRQRHMYVVGQTGTGKSTFLENLALQDMIDGNGFAFVDPHGDTAEKLLSMVPRERTEDVIYFSPAEMDYPLGLNLFEFQSPEQKDFLIQEVLNMLYKLYDPQHQGIMGPRYEHLFRNAALTVMADPNGGTFIDIPKLFRDPNFVKQKLQYVKDPNVLEFWQKEMPQSQRSNEFGEIVGWFVSKFGAFLSNEMMRNIIGQSKSAFDLRDVMDNKKILLVNLSKGRTGQLNMQLLGMIFVMKFQAAAMSRANIPESERVDFSLYVDEFQNFSTDSFATILSEARKYRLNLIVANQFTTQLTEEIREAVFGNVGTTIGFRVGDRDAETLRKYFRPAFDETDLIHLPNYNAIVRTMIGGVPTQPFSMATLPPLGTPNAELSDALRQLSAAKYGRPKAVVEAEIFERMTTKTPPAAPAPAFGGGGAFGAPASVPAGMPSPGLPPAAAPKRPGTGSFLDEWLSKKQGGGFMPPAQAPMMNNNPMAPYPAPSGFQRPMTQQPTGFPRPSYPQQRPLMSPPTAPIPQQNISSTELEKKEVDTIAHEIERSLGGQKPGAAHAHVQQAPPVQPQPSHVAGEIPLRPTGQRPDAIEHDTITIDQDGNLRYRDDNSGNSAPAA